MHVFGVYLSGELDKINACLWGISWDLNVRSINIDGDINDVSSLDDFEGYDAEHKVEDKTAEDKLILVKYLILYLFLDNIKR